MGRAGMLPAAIAAIFALAVAGCRTPRPSNEWKPPPDYTNSIWGPGGPPGTPGYAGPPLMFGVVVAFPTFDGHVRVSGVRGEDTRKTAAGPGLRASVAPSWGRFDFELGVAETSSSLGIPDQEPSNFLVSSETSNSFVHFILTGGPRLLDTHPPRAPGGEPAGEPWKPATGTRLDLAGGIWIQVHDVEQYVAFLGDEVTESETWVMPSLGLRASHDLSGGFRLEERFDAAGFRPGTANCWRAEAAVGVRLWEYFWMDAGLSIRSLDLSSGGSSGHEVDALVYGPFVVFEWRF